MSRPSARTVAVKESGRATAETRKTRVPGGNSPRSPVIRRGRPGLPQRVLPFFPAFLAGMTLVVLADDAFTFLVNWNQGRGYYWKRVNAE